MNFNKCASENGFKLLEKLANSNNTKKKNDY